MFDCKLDDACNTIGRIYYIPAKWSDDSVFMKVSGEPLNIEKAKEIYYKEFTRPAKHVEPDSVEYEVKHVANDKQDITDDDIVFLLKAISGRPSRKDWIRLSWAVHSYTPNAMTVLREAWPEEAKGEYDTLINKQYKGTKAPTIGSVIYEAMQCDRDIMKKLPSKLTATPTPTIPPKNQNWVERFSDCVVIVIDAPCGAGITHAYPVDTYTH